MNEIHPCMNRCGRGFARYRGLCPTCYEALRSQIRAGKTTWEQLEREGKMNARAKSPWNRDFKGRNGPKPIKAPDPIP